MVNPTHEDALDEVRRGLTDGLGADVSIEAVGTPAAFELAVSLARPGGHIANIGVHGEPATLHLETLWIKDVTITTGLVDTFSTPTFLKLLAGHQLDASNFATHTSRSTSSSRPTTCSHARRTPARSRSCCTASKSGSHGTRTYPFANSTPTNVAPIAARSATPASAPPRAGRRRASITCPSAPMPETATRTSLTASVVT